MRALALPVPDYIRVDRVVITHVLKNTDAKVGPRHAVPFSPQPACLLIP